MVCWTLLGSCPSCGALWPITAREKVGAVPLLSPLSRSSHLAVSPVYDRAAALSTVQLSQRIDPTGIGATPCGVLIVSSGLNLYAVQPATGRCQLIPYTRSADFNLSIFTWNAVEVVNSERCAYLSDPISNSICRITLPPQWFVAPI